MMTSVTLPSTSGASIHGGGFPEAVTGTAAGDFETPRPPKRSLSTPPTDACKKRRKQTTPVRISATDSPPADGKPAEPPTTTSTDDNTSTSSTEVAQLQCPVCQLPFAAADHLQSHLATEHLCKQEPVDAPDDDDVSDSDSQHGPQMIPGALNSAEMKHELPPWLPDIPTKDWINPGLLGFPGAAAAAANSLFMTLPPFAAQPEAMPPRQPIRIFNPDAYCELCNKEFCNKYFLKTHKANKHGIFSDPPPSDSNPSSSTSSLPSVNIPSYVNHMKLPPGLPLPTNLDLAVKMEKSYDMFTGPFGKMFAKAAKPHETDSSEVPSFSDLGPTESEPQQHEESLSPRNVQNETTSNTSLKSDFDREPRTAEQEPFYTSPVKLSPGQQPAQQAQPPQPPQMIRESYQDLSARLRRIGVMNPKAFCEICCKEYCNKYFLRTHKMKRHGIYIPDDRDSKDNKSESGNPYTQTSPLNLIMGEQSSNSSDRKTSSPSDISCDICGIKFQNASLFQLHNVSVHAKLPDPPQLHQSTNLEIKKSEEKSLNTASSSADSISEDLQKLQTMILQLNDLDVSKVASTCSTCATCGKDFENRYYLHAHMMTEHGLLLDDPADDKPQDPETSSNLSNINNNTMCDLCGKDFPNFEDMKKHLYEAHKTPAPSQTNLPEVKEEYNGFTTPEKASRSGLNTPSGVPPPGPERRSSMNLTPTSSYCEICNKELCNKYFMKTHMQRMHGIEIENGAQIGGVICDICNKELCSKYFLRVHKHNTHGIVEYGSNLMQPKKFEESSSTPPMSSSMAGPANVEDAALKPPGDLADLSHRYFSHFTEVCAICSRRFRSTKWLKAHLLSDHGQAGAEKWAELEAQLQQTMGQQKAVKTERVSPTIKVPSNNIPNPAEVMIQQQQQAKMQNVLSSIFGGDPEAGKTYHCSYCPFSTPVLPFLFIHERSHTQSETPATSTSQEQQVKCPVCMQSFAQPDQLQHHVFTQHPFLPLPPFFNGFNGSNEDASKEPSDEDADEQTPTKTSKKQPIKRKPDQGDHVPLEGASAKDLKETARKSQLPAAYALPQADEEAPAHYVMQPFLLEESTNLLAVPSIVYLPVANKLTTPITATFTLTPA